MSAAKMVADSTQSELADSDSRKRKKKIKKSGKKVTLPEDENADLDLKKELKPIGTFINDRPKMIEEMFHSVRGTSLQRALPELLKSLDIDELKQYCLEQLEVMSRKRLRRILAGEESANISSSGTDDESSDEGAVDPRVSATDATDVQKTEGHVADSTSVHQEQNNSKTDFESAERNTESFPCQYEDVVVKQEPPDSPPGMDEDQKGPDDNDDEDDMEDEEEDDDEEEEEEAYTTGSEDGELVHREMQPVQPDYSGTVVKQEVLSDAETETATGPFPDEPAPGHSGTAVIKQEARDDEEEEDGDGVGEDGPRKVEDLESELMSTVGEGAGDNVDLLLPSIMMDQMELLELEMRARAIKAMLTSHQEGDQD